MSINKRGTMGGPRLPVFTSLDAYTVGCGVLATIEQWYPARKFNGTMVPHKRNSKVCPGLVTKEKTMKYPASAMCTVWVCVCVRGLVTKSARRAVIGNWGGGGGGVPLERGGSLPQYCKELQWGERKTQEVL